MNDVNKDCVININEQMKYMLCTIYPKDSCEDFAVVEVLLSKHCFCYWFMSTISI